jgi:hypothetical protein
MDTMDQLAYQINALKPPAGWTKTDFDLKQAATESLAMDSDIRDGLDNGSVPALDSAMTHQQTFTDYLNAALVEVNAYSPNDTCP